MILAQTAWTQEPEPHMGYVYPAGGQQGTTFRVWVGGEHLDGVSAAHFSDVGVQARVMDYIRPLNQGAFKEVQKHLGEMMKKKEAAAPPGWIRGGRGGSRTFTNAGWTSEDEKTLAHIRGTLSTFFIRRTSVPALVETVLLEVSVARDAQPGQRELRLQTANGLTNPLVFEVGQLREIAEESQRSTAIAASQRRGGRGRRSQQEDKPVPGVMPVEKATGTETTITLPVLLNGQILPGEVDRYRFRASKGQHLVVAVGSRQLIPYLPDAVPGWFQAAVTLFDPAGAEIARGDDLRFRPDPVLHCEIPKDGEYVLEVRDALYRGREDFVYRIAIGELPYLTGLFPLGGRTGEVIPIDLVGWNLPATTLKSPAQPRGVHFVSVLKGTLLSNRKPFVVDTMPECREREPNNEISSAQRIGLPVVINGRIDHPGDKDVFCFEGRAGQQIVAEVKARRLGSLLDSALSLIDANGKQTAFNDDWEDRTAPLATHHADSCLRTTLPAEGLYYLHVVDQQGKGGAEHGYRLHVAAPNPDFELRIVPPSINARAGTTVPIVAHVLRREGFTGDVALSLKEAPPGFRLCGAHVPAGQDSIPLTLSVPTESRSEPYSLSIVGRASIQGREVTRPAVPAEDMMQAFAYRHLVPARELQVCAMGPPQPFRIDIVGANPVRIPVGGKVRLPISVTGAMSLGTVELELSEPPAGITIENFSLGRGSGEIVFHGEPHQVKPGLKGNLIVKALAVRDPASMKGKEQRKRPRLLLSVLPAIPFEIIAPGTRREQ